jgi:hypothetical protein
VCDLLVSGASVVKTLVDVIRACYRHIAVAFPTMGLMSDGFRQMFHRDGDTSGVMNSNLSGTRDIQHQHIYMVLFMEKIGIMWNTRSRIVGFLF